MFVEDGKGGNGPASVSAARRLNVSSKTRSRMFYVSRDDQLGFNIPMPSFEAAAGNYVFYIKNTSADKDLMIDSIEYHSEEWVQWNVWEVTGTAAGGNALTPVNIHLGKGRLAEATAMGGGATITGLTLGNLIGVHRTQATGEAAMDWAEGLILGPDTAIMAEYQAGTGGLCEIDCLFHYETVGAT
jgi:hypothetical protein